MMSFRQMLTGIRARLGKPPVRYPSGPGVDYGLHRAYVLATTSGQLQLVRDRIQFDELSPFTGKLCPHCSLETQKSHIDPSQTFCNAGCDARYVSYSYSYPLRYAYYSDVIATFDVDDTANVAEGLRAAVAKAAADTEHERLQFEHCQAIAARQRELAEAKPPVCHRGGLRCEPDGYWTEIRPGGGREGGKGRVAICKRGHVMYETEEIQSLPLTWEANVTPAAMQAAYRQDFANVDAIVARCEELNFRLALNDAERRGINAAARDDRADAQLAARAVNSSRAARG